MLDGARHELMAETTPLPIRTHRNGAQQRVFATSLNTGDRDHLSVANRHEELGGISSKHLGHPGGRERLREKQRFYRLPIASVSDAKPRRFRSHGAHGQHSGPQQLPAVDATGTGLVARTNAAMNLPSIASRCADTSTPDSCRKMRASSLL